MITDSAVTETATRFTEAEFDQFLDSLGHEYEQATALMEQTELREYVYTVPVTEDHSILVYSTVSTETDEARTADGDAIRVKIRGPEPDEIVGSEPSTHRREGWRDRLAGHISDAIDRVRDSRTCPSCAATMLPAERHHGTVYDCVDCQTTVEGDGDTVPKQ